MSFTIDDAVDEMTADVGTQTVDDAPVVADPPVNEEISPEADPEGDDVGAEEPASEGVEEGEPVTDVAAPQFWSKERKELFKTLPPEIQAAVREEWENGERTHQKRMSDAADLRKQADAALKEAATRSGLNERITAAAEQAESVFSSRWGAFTDAQWLQLSQNDPAKYTQLRAAHDAEQSILQRAQTAREEAEQTRQAEWGREQSELLTRLSPELADPKTGAAERSKVADYLSELGRGLGHSEEEIQSEVNGVSAIVASLARKAMLYDQGVMAASRAPITPQKSGLKSSPAEQGSSQQRAQRQVMDKFRKTGSIEDAVDALMARK